MIVTVQEPHLTYGQMFVSRSPARRYNRRRTVRRLRSVRPSAVSSAAAAQARRLLSATDSLLGLPEPAGFAHDVLQCGPARYAAPSRTTAAGPSSGGHSRPQSRTAHDGRCFCVEMCNIIKRETHFHFHFSFSRSACAQPRSAKPAAER